MSKYFRFWKQIFSNITTNFFAQNGNIFTLKQKKWILDTSKLDKFCLIRSS